MIHVGIDLGKRQSHACMRGPRGEIRHLKLKTTREGFTKQLGSQTGRILIEAGANAEWVARHLESLGWDVVVGDPNFAPMYLDRSRRVKTDRRDAEALLLACEKGNYRPAHRLSDAARAVREQAQVRKSLVRMRARVVVQARTYLHVRGLPEMASGTATFVQRWKKLEAAEEVATERKVLQPLIDVAEVVGQGIATCDAMLETLADDVPDMKLLMSAPAIGSVTAATWLGTLDKPERFARGEHLASYVGVVPWLWSSSESSRQGGITKKGPAELRSLLIEAAWRIYNGQAANADELRAWAQRIAHRRGRYVAVVALARRLTHILLAIWRTGKPYDASKIGHRKAVEVQS